MNHTQPPSRPRLSLVVNQPPVRSGSDIPRIGSSQNPGVDPFASLHIELLSLNLQSLYVRQFLEEVLAEPDLRAVLATPVRVGGKKVNLLVQVVQPVAEEAQRRALGCTEEIEAVYVATILLAIDYFFFPALYGKYDAVDALKTIVSPVMQRLGINAPKAATALRTCMRWGNFDEEGFFTDWLERRMERALEVLKLASF